jgi:uncharacterized protein YndB with AHSA1/START domain
MTGGRAPRLKLGRQQADPLGAGAECLRRSRSTRVAVRVTQRVQASPERVFGAWIEPGTAARWLFATASRPAARVSIDARAGGSFCFVERRAGTEIEHAGHYLEISPPRRLVFNLSGRANGRTRVSVHIVPVRSGSEVTVVHERLPQEQARTIEGRWSGMLYGLGTIFDRSSTRAERRMTSGHPSFTVAV